MSRARVHIPHVLGIQNDNSDDSADVSKYVDAQKLRGGVLNLASRPRSVVDGVKNGPISLCVKTASPYVGNYLFKT